MRRALIRIGVAVVAVPFIEAGVVKALVLIGVLHCADVCANNSWWAAALLGCWC